MVDGVETHHLSHNPVRNFLQIASTDPVMYSRVSPNRPLLKHHFNKTDLPTLAFLPEGAAQVCRKSLCIGLHQVIVLEWDSSIFGFSKMCIVRRWKKM